MSTWRYREDIDEVRQRLTRWWQGEDLGRPMLQLYAPVEHPVHEIPALPRPVDVRCDRFTARNLAYRVNTMTRQFAGMHFLGEAVPAATLSLGPGSLALYLGCEGDETDASVWFNPCIADPEQARFEFDPANRYWQFQQDLLREMLPLARGKFLLEFPDIIEGLDILAAMRGTQEMLYDLVERPDWVHAALSRITELYFRYYDPIYEAIKDETGGSNWWVWAPGRMVKLQCDCSAMISPEMFGEFMVPVLRKMTPKFDYTMYHWDGPGALGHHDHLLSLPDLTMIQWTAGAGSEPVLHPRWWPMYRKTVEAGKKLFIVSEVPLTPDALKPLKQEFGRQLNQFIISGFVASVQEAEETIRSAYAD